MNSMKCLIALMLLNILVGCAYWDRLGLDRKFSSHKNHYTIEVYNGGKVIFSDTFSRIIASSDDGVLYVKGDTLTRVSRDYVIKQTPMQVEGK